MQIIDTFIPKQYQDEILNTLSSTKFNWNYQDNTIDINENSRSIRGTEYVDLPYFHHMFFRNDRGLVSPYFGLVKPLLLFFEQKTEYKIKNTVRIVANLVLPTSNNTLGIPHIDADSNNSKLKTLLYYVNTVDGDTVLFNEYFNNTKPDNLSILDRVCPSMGKCIIFDSNEYHCSTTPTMGRRMVINIIVEVE